MFNRYQARSIWRRTFPETESVVLATRGRNEVRAEYAGFIIHHAKQRPSDVGESPQSGAVLTGIKRLKWQLWRDALLDAEAPIPKVGDVLRAGGIEWLIDRVTSRMFGELYDCECVERV